MSRLTKMVETLASLPLTLLAYIHWLLILVGTHGLFRYHIRRLQHDAVRTRIGFWSRCGYNVFRLWGLRVRFHQAPMRLPEDRPVIVVSSHHSSLDMVFLLGLLQDTFGRRNLRFVSRPGLDEGIPVISTYIKHYCYSLSRVGRFRARDQKEDRIHLAEFCQRMNAEKGVVTIFPEGVKPRGEAEHCRPFSRTGLTVMLDNMPDAIVLPLVIKGTGEFYSTPRRWKHIVQKFPRFGVTMEFSLLQPLEPAEHENAEAVISHCERLIHREYAKLRKGVAVSTDMPALVSNENTELDVEEAC